MSAPVARLSKAPETELSHVEFASIIVADRRAAMGLSVDQIRQMAAAILVLDQQNDDANRRMACMMVAEPPAPPEPEPAPAIRSEVIHVPLVTGGSATLTAALEELVKARLHMDQERHSTGENLARQKFERAAIAVCNHVTPKQRK